MSWLAPVPSSTLTLARGKLGAPQFAFVMICNNPPLSLPPRAVVCVNMGSLSTYNSPNGDYDNGTRERSCLRSPTVVVVVVVTYGIMLMHSKEPSPKTSTTVSLTHPENPEQIKEKYTRRDNKINLEIACPRADFRLMSLKLH